MYIIVSDSSLTDFSAWQKVAHLSTGEAFLVHTLIQKNIFYLLLIQGGNYLFPLLLLPYLGRVLGVEQFGVLSYCQAITQYFIVLTDYGFNLTATRRISIIRENPNELACVFSSTSFVRIVLALLSLSILATCVQFVPGLHGYGPILFSAFIGVIGNALFPIWLFQGLEKMGSLMVANLFSKALSLALVLLLVTGSSHTALAAACVGMSNLLMAAMAYYIVWKSKLVRYVWPNRKVVLDTVKDGLPIFVAAIVGSSYMNLNSILLSSFQGNIAVGQFSMADKIRLAAQAGILPIVQAYYPRISLLYHSDLAAAKILLKKAIIMISIMAVFAFILIQLLAGWGILTFLGPQYSASVPLLRLEAILLPIVSVALIYGHLGLLAAGQSAILTKIYIVAGVLHVFYAIPLTLYYSASGTIYSVIFTESIVSGLIAWQYFQRYPRQVGAAA